LCLAITSRSDDNDIGILALSMCWKTYSVFQGFSKAKSANGGFDFKLEPIFDTAPAASKNKARFKSGQS
jgi:hypothetical protein